MRKVFSVTFALIVLLSMATSVQALESKTIERHNGASAYAGWTEVNGDVITDTYLDVTETDDGTDIYLGTYTWDSSNGNYLNEQSGYMFTNDDVFSVDKKLNSASLSEVEMEVYNYYTGESETLTVKADWIGKGCISKGSSTYSSRDGDYVWKSSDSSTSREASTTGSINGLDLGVNSYASLSNFKNAYMNMEK